MLRKLLEMSRYLMVLPVIGSLFLTISVVISGLGLVVVQEWELLQQGEYSARTAKQLTLTVIEAIDMFLVGAISYLIAVGLYKLFISQEGDESLKRFKIEQSRRPGEQGHWYRGGGFGGGFCRQGCRAPGPEALLYGGVSIAAVIGAVLFLRFRTGRKVE